MAPILARLGVRDRVQAVVIAYASVSPGQLLLFLSAVLRIPDCACERWDERPFASGVEQLPVPFGDDLNGAVDHFNGRLIVYCVRRHR